MLSDLQLVYMVPKNSTQLLNINTTKFQVVRDRASLEINHTENISPPPRNLSNPLNKLNTTEMIPSPPPPKKSQTLPKVSPPLQKNLNTSWKNLNLPEKLPLPKNSITITETISNTRTKSQPLPEKSQPLVKNSQSLLKKSQPPTP